LQHIFSENLEQFFTAGFLVYSIIPLIKHSSKFRNTLWMRFLNNSSQLFPYSTQLFLYFNEIFFKVLQHIFSDIFEQFFTACSLLYSIIPLIKYSSTFCNTLQYEWVFWKNFHSWFLILLNYSFTVMKYSSKFWNTILVIFLNNFSHLVSCSTHLFI
jgi:hypothetical protein